jgi:O-antigen/teichoic acid export membrane protein
VLVALDLLLIPGMGITGAAVAFLCSMGVNALLAHLFLRRLIVVRLERVPVRNILVGALVMAAVIAGLRALISFSHFLVLILVVLVGVVLYLFLVLRLDRGIHDELRDVSRDLGMPWPSWL